MNKDYITGFFDADGYITISKEHKNENAIPVIGFTNNVLEILLEIQEIIYNDLKLKGHISKKVPKNENHSIGYDLKYKGISKCILISNYLNSKHPKKKLRFELLVDLHKATKRNGKYTKEELLIRNNICETLLNIK